ncbi:MAG: TRAP transporter small permease [Bacillota bacterium]
MKIIKKILDISDEILEYLAMFFLVAMTVIIAIQVFTRYFFNMTPYWSEEVALLLMVWFGFMGIAIGVKKGIHLSIEYFAGLLPGKLKKIVVKIDELLVGIFGLLLLVYGGRLVSVTGDSTLPATQLPAFTLYLMAPVCGLMIVCYSVGKLMGIDVNEEKTVINSLLENRGANPPEMTNSEVKS